MRALTLANDRDQAEARKAGPPPGRRWAAPAVASAAVADPSASSGVPPEGPGADLFPAISRAEPRVALTVDGLSATYAELARLSATLATIVPAGGRLAVLAARTVDATAAVVAGIHAGATVIPVNPTATPRELAYLLDDCNPELIAHGATTAVPSALAGRATLAVAVGPDAIADADAVAAAVADAVADTSGPAPGTSTATGALADAGPAVIMYTSGTTGPPKGAVLSRAAIAANLDALASVWNWTADDVLVHALPLYHVHGLILGVLGPLRLGGRVVHTGRFDPATTVTALAAGGTMHFGVPTIYARLADAAEADPAVAQALARTRLLVSGSAGLPTSVQQRIHARTGHTIVERYGMTETMITTAVPAGVNDRAGTVGPPLPGVELRVVDDDGCDVVADGEAFGEVRVRTPSMFSGYLGRPEQTEAAYEDGWFRTGDVATIAADGYLRIVGRNSTDIIKRGGFKIGAGEIEDAVLEHPAVAEVAVKGWPDDDLGERVCAWVVAHPGTALTIDDLSAHLADALVAHKRPRVIVFVAALPRNAMGKVQKSALPAPPT